MLHKPFKCGFFIKGDDKYSKQNRALIISKRYEHLQMEVLCQVTDRYQYKDARKWTKVLYIITTGADTSGVSAQGMDNMNRNKRKSVLSTRAVQINHLNQTEP